MQNFLTQFKKIVEIHFQTVFPPLGLVQTLNEKKWFRKLLYEAELKKGKQNFDKMFFCAVVNSSLFAFSFEKQQIKIKLSNVKLSNRVVFSSFLCKNLRRKIQKNFCICEKHFFLVSSNANCPIFEESFCC
jgi:hypothetical protein